MTLMLHAGGEAIDFDDLRNLPTPDPTASHVPIPHHSVVDMVRYALGFFGHELLEEHHAVTADGMNYFGVLSLRSPYGDYTDMVGLRNSHKKQFPIGIAMGSRVFVCDNLAFHADHVIRRKHTANAKRDLPGLVSEVIEPLHFTRHQQAEKIKRYKAVPLPDALADQAIMAMYRHGVINVTRIADVLQAYEEPPHDWGHKSPWRLFNAATFILAGKVVEDPTKTGILHTVLESVCSRIN